MDHGSGGARSLAWGASLGGLCASMLAVVLAVGLVVYVAPRLEGGPAALGPALLDDGFVTFAVWFLLLSLVSLLACGVGTWRLRPRGADAGSSGRQVVGGLLGFAGVCYVPFAIALLLAGVR